MSSSQLKSPWRAGQKTAHVTRKMPAGRRAPGSFRIAGPLSPSRFLRSMPFGRFGRFDVFSVCGLMRPRDCAADTQYRDHILAGSPPFLANGGSCVSGIEWGVIEAGTGEKTLPCAAPVLPGRAAPRSAPAAPPHATDPGGRDAGPRLAPTTPP